MTGVAAQWCGAAPAEYRLKLEQEWREAGLGKPEWGARRAILGDLSPAATFIAANYNLPFNVRAFETAAKRILKEVEDEVGWMYETLHTDGRTKGRINYTVWSEVFSCPECSGEVVFLEEALHKETKRVRAAFPCPHCGAELTKGRMARFYESRYDAPSGETIRVPKRLPVLINYEIGASRFEKEPDDNDQDILDRVSELPLPAEIPTEKLPYMHRTHERARMDSVGVTHLHHFFLPRQAQALGALWRTAQVESDTRLRNMLLFFVEQAIWGMSVLARYAPTHFSQVNQYLNGVYYVGSQIVDVSPWYILYGKLKRLKKPFGQLSLMTANAAVTTSDATTTAVYDRMVAFHVQRGVTVPLSAAELYFGLGQHFVERDGMWFLPEQAAEYDKKRLGVREVLQLQIAISDERSAVEWMRQQLLKKAQTFQELQPQFMDKTRAGWQKHEKPLELVELLELNFLHYDGKGEVPSQIHGYLSTNFKELRNLPKDDAALRAKGKDRWYVPDPKKAEDLEKLRERTLLREFEEYRESKQRRIKVFRLEAVRAGFKRAWQDRDYATIIAVARKIPENVLQEDPKLLMWYDQAVTRSGGDL